MKRAIRTLYAAGGGLGDGDDMLGQATKLLNPANVIKAPIDLAKGAKGVADNALSTATMGADDQGDMKTEKDLQPLNDLDLAERNSRNALLSSGVDEQTAIQMANSLAAGSSGEFTRMQAYQFLSQVVAITAPSSTSVAKIFPMLGPLMMNRNYQVPEVLAILTVIGKYATEYPGYGIWDMAVAAAKGQSIDKALTYVRTLMLGKDNNFDLGASNDLVQAMMAIGIPGSHLTEVINTYKRMHQKTLQDKEQIGLQFALENAQWAAQAHKKMQEIYSYVLQKFPEWKHNPLFIDYMRAAHAITSVSAMIKTITDAGLFRPVSGVPTSIEPGKGTVKPASTASDAARMVLAQTPPPYNPPGGASGSTVAPSGATNKAINSLGPNTNQAESTQINTINGVPSQTDLSANQNAAQNLDINSQLKVTNQALQEVEQTYQSLQEGVGNLLSLKDDEAGDDVPFASPETIDQLGKQLMYTAQEGETLANKMRGLLLTIQQNNISPTDLAKLKQDYFKATDTNAVFQGAQQLAAKMQALISVWRKRYVEGLLFDTSKVPLMNIKKASFTYRDYQQAYEYQKDATKGYWIADYVQPLVQICSYMASQYQEVANNLSSMYSQVSGDNHDMQGWIQTEWRNYTSKARAKQIEARRYELAVQTGVFGNEIATNPSYTMMQTGGNLPKFIRLADIDKEATTVQDEWNMIYKGTDVGGYGNILQNPEKYRDTPTPDVRPSGKKKKKFKKIKLSDIVC